MKLRITLFNEAGRMRQQWGTAENPTLYGTTTLPENVWSLMSRAVLPDGTSIASHAFEGQAQGAAHTAR